MMAATEHIIYLYHSYEHVRDVCLWYLLNTNNLAANENVRDAENITPAFDGGFIIVDAL